MFGNTSWWFFYYFPLVSDQGDAQSWVLYRKFSSLHQIRFRLEKSRQYLEGKYICRQSKLEVFCFKRWRNKLQLNVQEQQPNLQQFQDKTIGFLQWWDEWKAASIKLETWLQKERLRQGSIVFTSGLRGYGAGKENTKTLRDCSGRAAPGFFQGGSSDHAAEHICFLRITGGPYDEYQS